MDDSLRDPGPEPGYGFKLDRTGTHSVIEGPALKYEIGEMYPNPSAGPVTILFRHGCATLVEIAGCDMLGEFVKTVHAAQTCRGFHSVVRDGRDASGKQRTDGLCFCRMTTSSGGMMLAVVVMG